MTVNKNSLLKASIMGLLSTCLLGIYFLFISTKFVDITFSALFLLFLVVTFLGSTYWIYQQMEYDRLTWKGEKRSWYSWMWWPSRKWGEAYYWRTIASLTIMVPLLLFFWLVFIYGYSLEIGILFAVLSFLLVIFISTDLRHWWEKKKQPLHEETLLPRTYNKGIIVMLVLVFILLILALPYIEEPKGNYQIYVTEQRFIETWENENITLTIAQDHTCVATYNQTTYSGRWMLDAYGFCEISWDQELRLPDPNNSSSLYPVEMVYLIHGGTQLNLYQPFSAPASLTLEKVQT